MDKFKKIYPVLFLVFLVLAGCFYFWKIQHKHIFCEDLVITKDERATEYPVTCIANLKEGDENLTFTFYKNGYDGYIDVFRDSKKIFSLGSSDIFDDKYIDLNIDFKSTGFELTDVTYDGYKDIIILSNAGAYQWSYKFFRYNQNLKTFDQKPLLEATSPDIDLEARTIGSYAKGRGVGDYFYNELYNFENDTYVLTKTWQKELVYEDYISKKNTYLFTSKELVGGEWVEKEKKTIIEDDPFQ